MGYPHKDNRDYGRRPPKLVFWFGVRPVSNHTPGAALMSIALKVLRSNARRVSRMGWNRYALYLGAKMRNRNRIKDLDAGYALLRVLGGHIYIYKKGKEEKG